MRLLLSLVDSRRRLKAYIHTHPWGVFASIIIYVLGYTLLPLVGCVLDKLLPQSKPQFSELGSRREKQLLGL